jgi:hypothetical protein
MPSPVCQGGLEAEVSQEVSKIARRAPRGTARPSFRPAPTRYRQGPAGCTTLSTRSAATLTLLRSLHEGIERVLPQLTIPCSSATALTNFVGAPRLCPSRNSRLAQLVPRCPLGMKAADGGVLMISVMMLVVVSTVFATVVVGMLNDHRQLPPSHFAVASMRASPLLRRRRSQRCRST